MRSEPGPPIVCLTSILFTHRMIMYTDFLPTLSAGAQPIVWADAVGHPDFDRLADAAPAEFEKLPEVGAMLHRYSLLRRMNEAAWDRHTPFASRRSFQELRRRGSESSGARWMRRIGGVFGTLRLHRALERAFTPIWLRYDRSPEAVDRLSALRPAALFTTSPFRLDEPGIIAAAKRQKIPTIALITSWDNLTTKNRMIFDHDAYVVWTERMKEELLILYPRARKVPVHVVGAPQFDVFFQEHRTESRAGFCARYGFDASKPLILYSLGSPDLIREHHGASAFGQRLLAGELGDAQMLVRPHPLHPVDPGAMRLNEMGPRIVLQRSDHDPARLSFQSEEDISLWVNSFRHADVVVNLSSTAAVDGAILDRPIVNLDYDPEPGAPNAQLVHDINHTWAHFSPIAASGGIALTKDLDETVGATNRYLADRTLDAGGRRWIADYVVGDLDGRAGERMADAVLSLARRHSRTHTAS